MIYVGGSMDMVNAMHAGDVGELVGAVAVVGMDVRCGGCN
jgi:hypothetical protein